MDSLVAIIRTMESQPRPRTKIQFLRQAMENKVGLLQDYTNTLTQLSGETEEFLRLVKEYRAAKSRRDALMTKIDSALNQAIAELRGFEGEHFRGSMKARFKMLQGLVKSQCGLVCPKSEPMSENDDRPYKRREAKRGEVLFVVTPANN